MKDFGCTVFQRTICFYQYDFNGMWMRAVGDGFIPEVAFTIFVSPEKYFLNRRVHCMCSHCFYTDIIGMCLVCSQTPNT
jgi:hypothetical protein